MNQAAEMMKNMSPEDIAKMMPGQDPEMVKQRLQNPEMFKGAMEKLNQMPEEDRKKMLQSASAMHNNGGVPDMSKMGDMSAILENPEMMKQVAAMAESQEGMDPEQAEMMKNAARQIQENPE